LYGAPFVKPIFWSSCFFQPFGPVSWFDREPFLRPDLPWFDDAARKRRQGWPSRWWFHKLRRRQATP
jgi:hypothetical protein